MCVISGNKTLGADTLGGYGTAIGIKSTGTRARSRIQTPATSRN